MTTIERQKSLSYAEYVKANCAVPGNGQLHMLADGLIAAESELSTQQERIAELERISSEQDQRRLLRLFDMHGVECGNCGCSMIARGGSLGDHHGLTAKADDSEDEQLCGYCAGLELATLREALEQTQRERDNYASQFTLSNKWVSALREEAKRLRGILKQWFDYERFCDQPYEDPRAFLLEGKRRHLKFREDAAKALSDPPYSKPAQTETHSYRRRSDQIGIPGDDHAFGCGECGEEFESPVHKVAPPCNTCGGTRIVCVPLPASNGVFAIADTANAD